MPTFPKIQLHHTFMALLLICGSASAAEPNTLTPEEQEAGFKLLFDGATTNGWILQATKEQPTEGWIVDNGTLHRAGEVGDIATVDSFSDFELRLQWKIPEKANSGIFFRDDLSETRKRTSLEMQVLDNKRHRNGKNPLTTAGSAYLMYAPSEDATRPIGEWNDVRLIANGNHVEYWLNDVMVVTYEIGSEDFNAKLAASKYKKRKGFGLGTTGHIRLQDHGDPVWYRSIRIRELPSESK